MVARLKKNIVKKKTSKMFGLDGIKTKIEDIKVSVYKKLDRNYNKFDEVEEKILDVLDKIHEKLEDIIQTQEGIIQVQEKIFKEKTEEEEKLPPRKKQKR